MQANVNTWYFQSSFPDLLDLNEQEKKKKEIRKLKYQLLNIFLLFQQLGTQKYIKSIKMEKISSVCIVELNMRTPTI
jgi:hypothetical protein